MSSLRDNAALDRALLLALGAAARALGRYRPVVLRYHSLDSAGSRLSVPLAHFAAQMDYLARAGFAVVPLAEALAPGAGGRRVALTFDDGYLNNLTDAQPILEAHGFPATFYIAPGLLGGLPPWAKPEQGWLRIMSEAELVGLAARPGVSIGAHTLTHPRLDELEAGAAEREIRGSGEALAALLGQPVATFCYPHGAYTPETVALVQRAGFSAACTVEQGSALRLGSRFEVCRVYISPRTTLAEFAALLSNAGDWKIALRARLRRVFED